MTSAVYAGSFDPITTGHLSVLAQACKLFDKVHVCVANNPQKKYMFNAEERCELVKECHSLLSSVLDEMGSVDIWAGLIIEYVRSVNADVIVRGIRGASDLQFEMGLAQVNKAVAGTPTIFFPTDAALADVSSSALKKRFEAGEDIATFCLPPVYRALAEKIQKT